ncbi:hypothetical protein GCM10011342_28660 [Aquisalinus flavus]|uniref:Lipoprotein n=1 Tax=Aquisalinus flavus TaxID=1526572 RepID=A0A8J2V342_9PROT|nr:hypothetical protein [Aquisalinus flavus]MBD0428155.1 hypothetical protein [Aquisalinus flavus]GGD18240.1 hypothetical protein GCM10011342_28660 [Aquisalinus flavus]
MKRHIILAALAAAALGVTGCAGLGAESYGDQLKSQGNATAALGKDWNEGEKSIERGREMIEDGNRKINDGERDKRRGTDMIRAGEQMKLNAEEMMRQREEQAGA